MSYLFQPKMLYRMPTHFGPSLGPRQGLDGQRYINTDVPKWTRYAVRFLANREQLDTLVPPGFSVEDEPIVTVEITYMTEIPWLAGRGYNMLNVAFPVTFHGVADHVTGDFIAVIWENMADPILSGREELGLSKIYCELASPQIDGEKTHIVASWEGYPFFEMEIGDLQPTTQVVKRRGEGLLHYKYIPKTEDWGEADVAYTTFTPLAQNASVVLERWQGKGQLAFRASSWEDLPTQCHIVNALAALEIREYLGAFMVKGYGGTDISEQRRLR